MKTQLNYLKASRDRRVQSSDIAKRKYEQVRQTRTQSLRDKSFVKSVIMQLIQEIQTYRKEDLENQKEKANKVKS